MSDVDGLLCHGVRFPNQGLDDQLGSIPSVPEYNFEVVRWHVAQLVEHSPDKTGVTGSNPVVPTTSLAQKELGKQPSYGCIRGYPGLGDGHSKQGKGQPGERPGLVQTSNELDDEDHRETQCFCAKTHIMEPIYNPDGTPWNPGPEYWKRIEAQMKPVLKRLREKEERRQADISFGHTIWIVLVALALIAHLILDGYAVRHGQTPMFFGR